MEILIYFLKANTFLVVFYAFYFGFFKNETFHKANRYFLVIGAIVALALPFFKSAAIQNTKVVPTEIQDVAYEWYFESEYMVVSPAVETYSYFDVFKFLYLTGFFVAFAIFFIRFIKTFLWFKSNKNTQGTAFSFFGKIFIDQNLEQKSVVFKHENIHVKQRHFLDLIFFEILQIIFWFNPVVYFYKKSIRIIHEFLADEAASKIAQDRVAYASLLVSKQFSIQPVTIFTQHFFNHSTLKSRIIMLSKNPSKKTALLKYGLLAPLFFIMLLVSSFTVVSDNKFERLYKNLNNDISEKPLEDLGFPESTKAFVNEEVGVSENLETIESSQSDGLSFLPDNEVVAEEYLSFPIINEDTFPQNNPNKQIFTTAEQIPEFIGGQLELYKWLANNIKYPLEARNNKIEGRVFARFVIEANGEIGDVKVMKGIGYGCDEEATRVLKAMPKWKPAMQNGYPVAIYYNMPIAFKLNSKKFGSIPSHKTKGQKKEKMLETENLNNDNKAFGNVAPQNLLNDDVKMVKKLNLLHNDKEPKESFLLLNTDNATTKINVSKSKSLVFVDGKELFLGMEGLSYVKPETIESLSVIKEPAKLQMYGPRAKDGVILIKTKTNFIKTDEKK